MAGPVRFPQPERNPVSRIYNDPGSNTGHDPDAWPYPPADPMPEPEPVGRQNWLTPWLVLALVAAVVALVVLVQLDNQVTSPPPTVAPTPSHEVDR